MHVCMSVMHVRSWNRTVQVHFIQLLASVSATFFQVSQASSDVPVTPPTMPDASA